jgi:hypothetical protein
MKKTLLLIGILTIVSMMVPSANAVFTSSHELSGTLSKDTNAFFIGKTQINGTFTGFPMKQLVNSSIVQDMGGFPLIGACTIANLDAVIVAEDINITNANSLEELFFHYFDHITQYSDVDITTDNGLFLLGINQGHLTVSSNLNYAITTFIPLEIIPDTTTRFFLTATNKPLTMQCSGDITVLTTISDTGTIRVKDRNGATLWTSTSPNNYLVIQEKKFSVTQHPPLSIFPLNDVSSTTPLKLSISPADPRDIDVTQLIENVSIALENFGEGTTSEFIKNLNELVTLIQATSLVANGAMVFLQTNDTVTIDHSEQQFISVGFARFNTLEITNVDSTSEPTIQADCTLISLGNHFYVPQAKRTSDGIVFPYELLIIWILALCVFIYVRFFLKPAVDIKRDESIKRYAIFLHIIVFIISFLLLDFEINSLFGISAFTLLSLQGFSAITGAFFLLELIIWVLGYIILAIPLQLLVYSALRLLRIGKGGTGIRKAIGDLSIWVFCGFYLLLFINILFSLIHLNSLFPLG